MYKTLKTGIITECSAFLRLPDNPDEMIMRHFRFQRHMGDIAVFSYPEGTRTTEYIQPVFNIFQLDHYCIIRGIGNSTKEMNDLIGLPVIVLFPNENEGSCTERIIYDTIATRKEHTWFSQIQLPNYPPTSACLKSTLDPNSRIILTTRHIP